LSCSSVALVFSTLCFSSLFFFNATSSPEIYTLSLHDALPICACRVGWVCLVGCAWGWGLGCAWGFGGAVIEQVVAVDGLGAEHRSEEHTSELQSLTNLVCRLLLEKKKSAHEIADRSEPIGLRP